MKEGRLAQLVEELGRRELDVVVQSIDARTDVPGLMREVLFENHMVPIVSTSHPLTKRKSHVACLHLMAYPWIAPPSRTRMRINLDRVMAENGYALAPRVITGSISVMQSLLQQDNHVSACSVMLATYLEARGEVHLLPLSAPFGPVGAVFRERDQHPQLQAFLGSLREQVNAYSQSRLATSTA